PEEALRAYARAYVRFTRDDAKLWAMLLDGAAQRHRELPDWYRAKVERLLGLVEEVLAPLIPDMGDRQRSARVLWASLHGISAVASTGAMVESLPDLVNDLIARYVAGLRPVN